MSAVPSTCGLADVLVTDEEVFGPRALPMDITKRLNTAINQILLEPEMKTRLQNDGAEVSALSIDEFSGCVRGEIAKYQGIIAAA